MSLQIKRQEHPEQYHTHNSINSLFIRSMPSHVLYQEYYFYPQTVALSPHSSSSSTGRARRTPRPSTGWLRSPRPRPSPSTCHPWRPRLWRLQGLQGTPNTMSSLPICFTWKGLYATTTLLWHLCSYFATARRAFLGSLFLGFLNQVSSWLYQTLNCLT